MVVASPAASVNENRGSEAWKEFLEFAAVGRGVDRYAMRRRRFRFRAGASFVAASTPKVSSV
jgi:hypothetical protein